MSFTSPEDPAMEPSTKPEIASSPTGGNSSSAAASSRRKYYFYHGHRTPSQNRPIVRGGIFSNRRSLPSSPTTAPKAAVAVDFCQWDPSQPSRALLPPTTLPAAARRLSPLARFVLDSFLRNGLRWCPSVLSDLRKLRRVPPDLVAEVVRHRAPLPLPPALATRFFHWAGRQKGFAHTFASYNALAYVLNDSRRPAAADQLPELMLSQGKPPSEKQLEILVRMHADAGRGLRLFHLYRKMRSKFSVKPRVFLYNRILDALVRTGHLDLAFSVYDDLRADGLKEEATTFTILAKGLCRSGEIEKVVELLDRMRVELCQPDVFAYTAMVKVLASEGNINGCLRIWEEMKKDGVNADIMAYSTMVLGLCNAGKVDKGIELLEEMKRKGFLIDRSVYGSLIQGFVAAQRIGDGYNLLKVMVDDGYRADLEIYDSLIGGLCSISKVDKAQKLFQIVIQEELVPSFHSVTPFLAYYADNQEMDKFVQLVDQLGKIDLPVLEHLSHFFTFFIGKGGREFRALSVFNDLKGKGYCSTGMYNILMEGFHKIKDWKQLLLLFEEIKSSNNFKPDLETYNIVIPCFVEKGDIVEACLCYNSLKEMSWVPNIAAYCSLVQGLCKVGQINAAITLVKDCLGNVTSGPMEFKYALTILSQCKLKSPEKVIGVLDEMIELGYSLEDITYCSVIYGFCKYASSVEARKVFKVMRDRKVLSEAKFIIYEDILNEHLKKATADLVISGLKFFGLESKLKWTSSSD